MIRGLRAIVGGGAGTCYGSHSVRLARCQVGRKQIRYQGMLGNIRFTLRSARQAKQLPSYLQQQTFSVRALNVWNVPFIAVGPVSLKGGKCPLLKNSPQVPVMSVVPSELAISAMRIDEPVG